MCKSSEVIRAADEAVQRAEAGLAKAQTVLDDHATRPPLPPVPDAPPPGGETPKEGREP